MTDRRSRSLGDGLVAGLVASDRMEVVLAGVLAGLVIVLDLATSQPWQPLALDLVACAAAACTPRWPRVAGIVLGAILALYIVIPPAWATLGEYALMIPILGTGMRGQRRTRMVMSAAYFVILAAKSSVDAPNDRNPVIGWVLWAVLIGALWLIGNAFAATVEAHKRARQAELLLQRQALARSLHDTVARSLTRVSLASERALLRGHASTEDLVTISDSAQRSTEELRWLMTLLRDPSDDTGLRPAAHTQLDQALADAAADLEKHGFAVTVRIDGDLDRLNPAQIAVMGSIAGEAAGNIIKHAQPETACAVFVDILDTSAEMVFVNRPRPGASGSGRPDSMGLKNIHDQLTAVQGQLFTDGDPDRWVTRIVVPLTSDVRAPETGSAA